MNYQDVMKMAGFVCVIMGYSWASDEPCKNDNTTDIEKLDFEAIARSRPVNNWASDPSQTASVSMNKEKDWKLKFDAQNPNENKQSYFINEPDSTSPSESFTSKLWNGLSSLFTFNSESNMNKDELSRDIPDEKNLEAYYQGGSTGYVPILPLNLTNLQMMSEEEWQDQKNLFDENISGPWLYNEYGRPYKIWGSKSTHFPTNPPIIIETEKSYKHIFQNNTKGDSQ